MRDRLGSFQCSDFQLWRPSDIRLANANYIPLYDVRPKLPIPVHVLVLAMVLVLTKVVVFLLYPSVVDVVICSW